MKGHYTKNVRFHMPTNLKPVFIPLYGSHYYFMTDPEVYAQVYDYMVEQKWAGEDNLDGCLGIVSPMNRDDGGRQYLVGVFDGDLDTLAHELGHLALFILERAGVPVCGSSSEAFCYLLGHLMGENAPTVIAHAVELATQEKKARAKEERAAKRKKAAIAQPPVSAPEPKSDKGSRRGRR